MALAAPLLEELGHWKDRASALPLECLNKFNTNNKTSFSDSSSSSVGRTTRLVCATTLSTPPQQAHGLRLPFWQRGSTDEDPLTHYQLQQQQQSSHHLQRQPHQHHLHLQHQEQQQQQHVHSGGGGVAEWWRRRRRRHGHSGGATVTSAELAANHGRRAGSRFKRRLHSARRNAVAGALSGMAVSSVLHPGG